MSLKEDSVNKEHLHLLLDNLLIKHKNNTYVLGRLVNHMEHLLPSALENAELINKQREERKVMLNANRDEFTTRFLHKNNYFYSSQTELFLYYDGVHFIIYNEDDIQHQILTTISKEKCLREWKHKVNRNIIKRIKDRSPLHAIPESETIQFVINTLCPSIFPTRNHVKYFLTIIGECINSYKMNEIKPDHSLIYIFSPCMKEIIREIGNQCYTYFGIPNVFTSIKYKFYDHKFNNCRLLLFENNTIQGRKKLSIPTGLSQYTIDFLCVAAHYAKRYGSSDNFLSQCSEIKLVDHALFLNKNNAENIVNMFIEKSFTPCITSTIETKNMFFLWKKFLDEIEIPNVIFHETLKIIFKNKLKYNEEFDAFVDITSIHLPLVSQFMRFWNETIISFNGGMNDTENENENDCELYELEIDEICNLFKKWILNNNTNTNTNSGYIKGKNSLNVNDSIILELIHHFYPEIVIEENKYVLHVKSKLWDKRMDVMDSLNTFKQYCKDDIMITSTSIYDAYSFYLTHNLSNETILNETILNETILNETTQNETTQNETIQNETIQNETIQNETVNMNNKNLVVSKHYFEQIVSEVTQSHRDNDNSICDTWWK